MSRVERYFQLDQLINLLFILSLFKLFVFPGIHNISTKYCVFKFHIDLYEEKK